MNPLVHLELHTSDEPAAAAFYTELLGWRAQRVHAGRASYLTLGSCGPLGAGVVGCEAARPVWLPYVAVPALEETAARACALGASVVLGPRGGPLGRRTVLSTPAGGELGLWEPAETSR